MITFCNSSDEPMSRATVTSHVRRYRNHRSCLAVTSFTSSHAPGLWFLLFRTLNSPLGHAPGLWFLLFRTLNSPLGPRVPWDQGTRVPFCPMQEFSATIVELRTNAKAMLSSTPGLRRATGTCSWLFFGWRPLLRSSLALLLWCGRTRREVCLGLSSSGRYCLW